MRLARVYVAPILWLGIAATLLLMPLPEELAGWSWHAILRDLQDLLHFPLFALLASVGFRSLRARIRPPDRRPYLWVILSAVTLAAITECLQALFGREASWQDLILDLFGAGFALLLHARVERREANRRRSVDSFLLIAATAIALIASSRFLWTVAAYAYRATQAPVMWRPDSLLLARFSHWQTGAYPGLAIDEPPADWRDWKQLEIRIRNRRDLGLPVVVRVHDRSHNLALHDRYNRTVVLQPDSVQTLSIALEDVRTAPVGREMDLGAIRGLIIFSQVSAGQTRSFDVLEIRLVR